MNIPSALYLRCPFKKPLKDWSGKELFLSPSDSTEKAPFKVQWGPYYQPLSQISFAQLVQKLDSGREISSSFLKAQSPLLWKEKDFEEAYELTQELLIASQNSPSPLLKSVPWMEAEFVLKGTVQDLQSHFFRTIQKSETLKKLFIYGFFSEKEGFFGASPEILFLLEPNQKTLKTWAIAGTCSQEEREEFEKSEKNIREHELVVQDLSERFKKIPHNLKKEKREILAFSDQLFHFSTYLGAQFLEEKNPEDLTFLLHPTAALGPFPKDSEYAEKWRKADFERKPQRLLGSPLLFTHNNFGSLCVVAIRLIEYQALSSDQILIKALAGAGVLKESSLSSEKTEIKNKIQASLSLWNFQGDLT